MDPIGQCAGGRRYQSAEDATRDLGLMTANGCAQSVAFEALLVALWLSGALNWVAVVVIHVAWLGTHRVVRWAMDRPRGQRIFSRALTSRRGRETP